MGCKIVKSGGKLYAGSLPVFNMCWELAGMRLHKFNGRVEEKIAAYIRSRSVKMGNDEINQPVYAHSRCIQLILLFFPTFSPLLL